MPKPLLSVVLKLLALKRALNPDTSGKEPIDPGNVHLIITMPAVPEPAVAFVPSLNPPPPPPLPVLLTAAPVVQLPF